MREQEACGADGADTKHRYHRLEIMTVGTQPVQPDDRVAGLGAGLDLHRLRQRPPGMPLLRATR